MDYTTAMKYLENSYSKGSRHNRDKFTAIMNVLDNPQDKIKIIHVAGTNGKGSTCTFLTNILMEAGYKVGTFTSPHLESYNERIKINSTNISHEDFLTRVEKVKDASDQVFENTNDSLGFFEILTGMAFHFFYEEQVDIAIIETGIGGRNDCTNIIKSPLCSVITSISYDHMECLGNTIEEITKEKAGIIKKNCAVVLYPNDDLIYNIVKEVFFEQNSTKNAKFFFYINKFNVTIKKADLTMSVFSVLCEYFEYEDIFLKQLGHYQIYNVTGVLTVVHALTCLGLSIPKKSIYDGIYNTRWPVRMEIISKNPLIVIDGAHNGDASSKLAFEMETYFSDKKIILIIGVLKDKDFKEVVNNLSKNAHTIIFTQPANKRALEAKELYECLDDRLKNKNSMQVEHYKKAITQAIQEADKNSVIIIAGSLYLAADARRYIVEINRGGDLND